LTGTAAAVSVPAVHPPDLLLTSTRVVTPEGVVPGTVVVRDGRVEDVVADAAGLTAAEVLDVGDLAVLPGLVDSHVHVNEPGRTHWEGFASATRAAALGGVTTIVDMPLNSLPPTLDPAALDTKRAAAAGQVSVDVAFWGGAVPENLDQLGPLHAAGVRGVKAFTCDSGVPEYGHVPPAGLAELCARVAAVGTTLLVHAEDPALCDAAAAAVTAAGSDPRSHATWLASRPAAAEVAAVEALVAASRATGARVHVLHLSSADAGDVLAAARADGVPVSAETCPHYLVLAAEDVPDGATSHKCAPPVRERANAERLWRHLADGTVQQVVSDHSPCPPADKAPDSGDFLAAWGGIASLQLGLPLVWTEARRRGHDLADVVRWMATAPAALAGLDDRGALRPGVVADLVVLDPDAAWTVDGPALAHRHPVTPYHGRSVTGRVVHTVLGGRVIVRDARLVGSPTGRLL